MSELYTDAEAESWADGIGAALVAMWTQAEPGEPLPASTNRSELLAYANPEPHVADILAGDNPERAVALWDAAISLLRQRGVIGNEPGDYVEHGPAPWREPAP